MIDIKKIVIEMQESAKKKGGALKDLALPEELLQELKDELEKESPWSYHMHPDGSITYRGTLIHTGEFD